MNQKERCTLQYILIDCLPLFIKLPERYVSQEKALGVVIFALPKAAKDRGAI